MGRSKMLNTLLRNVSMTCPQEKRQSFNCKPIWNYFDTYTKRNKIIVIWFIYIYIYILSCLYLTLIDIVNMLISLPVCSLLCYNTPHNAEGTSHPQTHTCPFSVTYVICNYIILCSKSTFLQELRYQLNLLPGCRHINRWGWFTVVSFNYQPWEQKVFLRVWIAIHLKDNYF